MDKEKKYPYYGTDGKGNITEEMVTQEELLDRLRKNNEPKKEGCQCKEKNS